MIFCWPEDLGRNNDSLAIKKVTSQKKINECILKKNNVSMPWSIWNGVEICGRSKNHCNVIGSSLPAQWSPGSFYSGLEIVPEILFNNAMLLNTLLFAV